MRPVVGTRLTRWAAAVPLSPFVGEGRGSTNCNANRSVNEQHVEVMYEFLSLTSSYRSCTVPKGRTTSSMHKTSLVAITVVCAARRAAGGGGDFGAALPGDEAIMSGTFPLHNNRIQKTK